MRRSELLSSLTRFQGQDRYNEARVNFVELAERYGETPLLLNGRAVAEMCLGHFEEAEQTLVRAKAKVLFKGSGSNKSGSK